MHRSKRASTRWKGLTLAFALLFILSSGMLIHDLVRSAREQAANEALVQRVEQEVSQGEGTSETSNGDSVSAETPTPERNYQPLVQENNHLAAWLMIENTEVNYPVMYTPDAPEYYLRKAFDGSYALSGSLFIGADCIPDGSNIIIYGHNMKDSSMFGVGMKLLLVAPPQLARNLTSDASPARLAETGYSHPFPSDSTLVPGRDATNLASRASRRAARRGEREPSRVRAGSPKPEYSQLLTRAIASAPAADHAHGNDAILTLYMCCCSASMVPIDGPPPISAAWRRR